jgi:uncharacterized protein
MNVIDARVRVPLRDSADDPLPEVPPFMAHYDAVLDYTERNGATPAELLAALDEAGIERCFLHAEYEFFGTTSAALNDRARRLAQAHPGRFVTFAAVELDDALASFRQARRALTEEGFTGLNLQPGFRHLSPADSRLYPLYALAADLGAPVAIHTGINYSTVHRLEAERPIHLDQIACEFPDLLLIACHGGWPWVAEMVAVMRKHRNVFIDIGAIAPRYLALPGAGWEVLWQFMNTVLREQVLFATDWPMISFERALREIDELPLRDGVKERLLAHNALGLLDRVRPPAQR